MRDIDVSLFLTAVLLLAVGIADCRGSCALVDSDCNICAAMVLLLSGPVECFGCVAGASKTRLMPARLARELDDSGSSDRALQIEPDGISLRFGLLWAWLDLYPFDPLQIEPDGISLVLELL